MEERFSHDEWETCLKVLNLLKDEPFSNPDNQVFKTLITSIYKQAKKQNKRETIAQKKTTDLELLKNTTIVANALNFSSGFSHIEEENGPPLREIRLTRNCYICNESYTRLHSFYHKLCPACADTNYEYRSRKYDFSGYNVIITGGRVKIGYATVLKFLRSNANVILTTRFPALAFEQLKLEDDYAQWKDRLTVYGLDLRSLNAVHQFIDYCSKTLTSVDILVNNAAQTIKYPFEYYQPLIAKENRLLKEVSQNLLPNVTPITFQEDLLLPAIDDKKNSLNRFGQPVDSRAKNSWNSTQSEIALEELLEVNLINHISPYQLISGLRPLMLNSLHAERFIINVTSSEGQFSYSNKTIFHPHTNMTKAALNMLTRTSASEFINDSIFMTAVDVGWVSTGANEAKREKQFANLQIPPLDPLDGAMRIIHPIDEVLNGNKALYGVLLKNYKVVNW